MKDTLKELARDIWAAATCFDLVFLLIFAGIAVSSFMRGDLAWGFVSLIFAGWQVVVVLWKAVALKWQRMYETERERNRSVHVDDQEWLQRAEWSMRQQRGGQWRG
jgi:hypothetical protein